MVRPRGTRAVRGEPREYDWVLGSVLGPQGGKGPTCDDVLNGTIFPLVHRPVLLGLAPPQLSNQLLLLPLVPLGWGLEPSI